MERSRKKLYEECRKKLLKFRQDRMMGLRALDASLHKHIEGDEGDMASALEDQHNSMRQREILMQQVREMDEALQRLDNGSYGVCDETGEEIGAERLMAIPWTRLSLEGAEVREVVRKRFANE